MNSLHKVHRALSHSKAFVTSSIWLFLVCKHGGGRTAKCSHMQWCQENQVGRHIGATVWLYYFTIDHSTQQAILMLLPCKYSDFFIQSIRKGFEIGYHPSRPSFVYVYLIPLTSLHTMPLHRLSLSVFAYWKLTNTGNRNEATQCSLVGTVGLPHF